MNDATSSPVAARTRRYRAPLVPAALSVMAGIVAGRYLPLPAGFWALLAATAMVVVLVTLVRAHLRLATAVAAAVMMLALAATYARLEWASVTEDHIVTFTDHRPILATIRARIVTSPQIAEAHAPPVGYHPPARTVFVVEAGAIRTRADNGPDVPTAWMPASGLVRVSVDEPDTRLTGGQDVELVGWLGRFRPAANPGQFDQAAFARQNHTLVWMTVPVSSGATILDQASRPWYARALWHLRSSVRQHLMTLGNRQDGRLINALVIGQRHPALRKLNQAMMRAGVAHLLSISGMHLGIFLGFVYLLCRLVSLTPRRSAIAVLVVLGTYMLLAEPRAPLLRSAMMAAALCVAAIVHRRYVALNALAAAAIVLLAIDPLQLFSAGFQLSFAIVAGLVLLRRWAVQALFGGWIRRRGLMVFRGEHRISRWFRVTAADWAMQATAMCVVAYVVAAPLVAYHFGLFSPYAPLLSILLLVPVTAVLVPGYVSAALAWPMPNLSAAIGQLAAGAAEALAWCVRQMTALPGLGFELRPVGVAVVVLFYAALGVVAIRRRVRLGNVFACVAAVVLLAVVAWSQRTAPAPNAAELDLLAVGSGQCAILRTPSGRAVLIDAGTNAGYDAYEYVIEPFLSACRLAAPDEAFLSHANSDHYGAMLSLMRRRPIRRVYLNDYFGLQRGDWPPPEGILMDVFGNQGVDVVRLRAGRRVQLDDRTSVEVLWPPTQLRDDLTLNDTSLVLRITCDGVSVLLPGDLDETGQAELIATGNIRADALVLPHHGGWERTLPEFVAAVAPKTILVSTGRKLRPPASPSKAARQFYRTLESDYRFYSTYRDGWTRLRLGRGGVRVQTMR